MAANAVGQTMMFRQAHCFSRCRHLPPHSRTVRIEILILANPEPVLSAQCSVLSAQCSVLSAQCSVLSAQCLVLLILILIFNRSSPNTAERDLGAG